MIGNGRAPIALAADQPVAQTIVDCLLANAFFFQPVRHRADGLGHGRAIELGRVNQRAFLLET